MTSSWEMLIAPAAGDSAPAINSAISSMASTHGGGTVRLHPLAYTLEAPIVRASNVKIKGAFCGAHLFDTALSEGTILTWAGAQGGVVIYDAPAVGADRIDNGGVFDLSIDGAGVARTGLQSMSSYCAKYARIHCVGVTAQAYYFGTLPSPAAIANYHSRLDDLTAAVIGPTHGIVLDGTPGAGRNTCFVSARNCHITFQHGVAYALSNCDDCGFVDCAGSMVPGSRGAGIYFGGSSDGSLKAAYANRFIGWNCNAPISAAGGTSPSRGNLVVTNSVDGVPAIYQSTGATITVANYDGEVGFNGFVRNPLKSG